MKNINNIFISAGETSGDMLGANLARALLQKSPAIKLAGMGGKKMQDAGVSVIFDSEKLAVVGFVEIFIHLFSIIKMWRAIKKYFRTAKPDLVILIDLPDTHFRFLKTLKQLNIPVLYYVSPQIWAWRAWRIKAIQKYVNHMAVLFSFEEKIYQNANVPVTFVGHPLGDIVKPTMTKNAAYDFFQLDENRPVVTLFPGSRRSELKNHLFIIIDAVKKIAAEKPETQFTLMLADHFDAEKIRSQLPSEIKIIQKNMYDLLQITDAAIAVSGTVTLEIALMQVPLCIIYKMKSLSFWIAKKLIRVNNIGLCNIIAEKTVAREFIQDDVKPIRIADEIIKLLDNKNYHDRIQFELAKIKNKVSVENKNSSEIVADIALRLI